MSALMPGMPGLRFGAPLTGLREVPPVMTPGSGDSFVTIAPDESSLHVRLMVQNLRQVTQAHIHLGMPGENGPVVLWLFMNQQGIDAVGPTTLTDTTFRATDLVGPLAGMNLSALVQEIMRGNAYVNVHTVAHPGGEVRGQLRRG